MFLMFSWFENFVQKLHFGFWIMFIKVCKKFRLISVTKINSSAFVCFEENNCKQGQQATKGTLGEVWWNCGWPWTDLRLWGWVCELSTAPARVYSNVLWRATTAPPKQGRQRDPTSAIVVNSAPTPTGVIQLSNTQSLAAYKELFCFLLSKYGI